MQAGRELRVVVKPEQIDDLTSYKVAREIKDKIEETMQYPGTIKVVVIRETRAEEVAKQQLFLIKVLTSVKNTHIIKLEMGLWS